MTYDIDRIVAAIAPDTGPGLTPGAMELLDEITSMKPSPAVAPRFRRRWLVLLPVTAGLAAAAVLLSWVLPGMLGLGAGPASAALDIRREGGYYVVTVKNLLADPVLYQRELRARGLNISIMLFAAPPSLEGSIFTGGRFGIPVSGPHFMTADGAITTVRANDCLGLVHCPIGIKVPVGYKGRAAILLGRRARPGEDYTELVTLAYPGEPLHCVDFVNKTVDEVLTMLTAHGVYNTEFAVGAGMRSSVPGGWFVHEGVMAAQGKARLVVAPAPTPRPRPADAYCPGAS